MCAVPLKPVPDSISAAHAAICRTIASIPRGTVTSYGEIAARAGLPRRARLVGRVLRASPAGSQLPWHRVLRSGGRIAFTPGSAEFREQVRRLASEGVLCRNGRVDLAEHGWERDIDDVLWGPASDLPQSASGASRPLS